MSDTFSMLAFNDIGCALTSRIRNTLKGFIGGQLRPAALREMQKEADLIVRSMLENKLSIPDSKVVVVVIVDWNEQSVQIHFPSWVLALITEPVGPER